MNRSYSNGTMTMSMPALTAVQAAVSKSGPSWLTASQSETRNPVNPNAPFSRSVSR